MARLAALQRRGIGSLMVSAAVVFAAALLAHLPSLSKDEHAVPQQAFELDDIDTSIVLYDVVSCEAPQVWLSFETQAPNEALFVQLGLPTIDRLADRRPAVAVLAPGLPDIELPFEIPRGVGGLRFDTDDVAEPDVFYEPFTDTVSWILYEGITVLPEVGHGWIVAWDPSDRTGKLWVAVGTEEQLSGGFEVSLEDIWAYYETHGQAPDDEVVEQQCERSQDLGRGCSCELAERGGAWGFGLLVLGAGMWLRRRY